MADPASKMIREKTKACFGTPGDLGDLIAGMVSRNAEEMACAVAGFYEVVRRHGKDLYIPPTGISLIRHVYHRVPPLWQGATKSSLLQLTQNLETPTEEALAFLEEILMEDWHLSEKNDALDVLEKFGRPSLPILFRILQNGSFRWPHKIVSSFSRIGLEKEDIRPLVEALSGRSIFLLDAFSMGDFDGVVPLIKNLGEETMEELTRLYSEGDASVRFSALKLIGHMSENDPGRFLPVAFDALKGSDGRIRRMVSYFLSYYLSPESVLPQIIDALDDPDDRLREGLTGILSDIVLHFGVFRPLWLSKLVLPLAERLEDSSADVRRIAAEGLEPLGILAKNALPLLLSMKLNDSAEKCRNAAATAIENIEKEVL